MNGYNTSSSNGNSGANGSGTSGSTSGGFPLRTNFFRSLALSKETKDALYTSAKANAEVCLKQSFNEQWRYVPPEKDGTQLRKDTSNLATSCRYVRAATVLRCQEHEVNMVIANTNTESWREFMRKCFGKNYIDTMILHSFAGPSASSSSSDNNRAHRSGSDRVEGGSSADPTQQQRQTMWLNQGSLDQLDGDDQVDGDFTINTIQDKRRRGSDTQSVPSDEETGALAGDEPYELLTVKWGALDTGGQGKRDLCVVDYLSTAVIPNEEENKDRVHMWCFSSVEGERVGCMALKDTHNISRTSLSKLGVFWRRVNDEETEVIVCGSFASKHAKYASAIFLQSLNRLQGIVEDLRLSNQIYIHRSTWVKDHERSSCHLCMRNFYALRRKHHCRRCGEVICSDCSVVENVDLPVIGYSKLRLCKVCCLKAKSTPLKRNNDKSNVFDHVVRARSLSNVNVNSHGNNNNTMSMASPYNRMSFADSGSSGVITLSSSDRSMSHNGHHFGNHHSHTHTQSHQLHHSHHHHPHQLQQHAMASQLTDATPTSRSSSSFSSSNTNDFELADSLEEYQQLINAAAATTNNNSSNSSKHVATVSASAVVHPLTKEMRGLGLATNATASTMPQVPTTTTANTTATTTTAATQEDDDYDDFIDAKCLNKQLKTMELKQKQKNASRGGTGGVSHSNMFDLLCDLACQTLNCPIASVSILDAQQGDSIRSVSGIADRPELDEELTLFIDKVMGSTPTIVLDANVDKQVTSLFTRRGAPSIRFFAGCPIYSRTGKKLGYICVADFTKRDTLGPSCAFTMERLATLAVTTMEKNLAANKQPQNQQQPQPQDGGSHREPSSQPPPITPYVTGDFTTNTIQSEQHPQPHTPPHPAAIFDRPVAPSASKGTMPRHRQSSAQPIQAPAQHQLHHEQPVHARVYDLAETEAPMTVGSPMAFSAGTRGAPPPPPAPPGTTPVAPLPRQYNEYSAGYYEAQERMRKLLIKSYNTQQQLSSTPPSATSYY